jgi:ribosomal protein S25
LLQIAQGDPGAVLSLKKKLTELSGHKSPARSQSTRTVGDLFERAEKIEEEAKRKAREEANRKRILRLEELAGNEEISWQYVEKLLQQKRGSTYDEATKLLVELRDMSVYKQRENKYSERLNMIREKYGKSVALMERFRRTGLI